MVSNCSAIACSCALGQQSLSSGQSSRKLISNFRAVFSLTLANGLGMWSLPFGAIPHYLSIYSFSWDTGHF